jgi:phosphatidylglycerophosphate synthase
MRDVYFSYFMLIAWAGVGATYGARALLRGRARHARSDADGGSVLLNKSILEMGYWMLGPVVDLLAALRISPNAVTAFSLVPSLAAAVAVAFGCFGLACVLATAGAFCDTVDGLLARRLGRASNSGEVFDAAVDRYVEYFFFAGLAFYYRDHPIMLFLVLLALLGAFMVSYSTAKAEAMGVPPPRGAMRRAERAVYLLVGSGFTGLSKVIFEGSPSHALRELPIILAISAVAVVANVSAVQRLGVIMHVLDARAGKPPASGPHAEESPTSTLITKRDTPAGLV